MDFLRSTVFFGQKLFLKSYYKSKSAAIACFFFSSFPSSRSFLFSFPFLSLLWFLSISGLRNVPFDGFSLKWLKISLGWFLSNRLDVFKNSANLSKCAISKVGSIKTKSSTVAFFLLLLFSFSSLFPFLISSSFLLWFWSFLVLRHVPFDAFSHKWLQISLGWFSNNQLDI